MDNLKTRSRAELKAFFAKNAIPTEGNFQNLIDAGINQRDDGIVKQPDDPLSILAVGQADSPKKVINFYRGSFDEKPAWTLALNPRVDPAKIGNDSKAGLSVSDASDTSRLFIDEQTGNIGVGTVEPGGFKLNVNGHALVNGNACFLNGNVGIGTEAPTNKLEVNGNIQLLGNFGVAMYFGLAGDNTHVIYRSQGDGLLRVGGQTGVMLGSTSVSEQNAVVRGVIVTSRGIVQYEWTDILDGNAATDSFKNGWKNNTAQNPDKTYHAAGYFIDSMGMVHLKGLIAGGTASLGAVAFTLNSNYYPDRRHIFAVATDGDKPGRVDVDSHGNVIVVTAGNAWVSLDGICYRARQG